MIETFLLSLFAPRRPYPGCGLFLILSCIIMTLLWFSGLAWYKVDAYPVLINRYYVSEYMRNVVHYSVLFGAPVIGFFLGFLTAASLSRFTLFSSARSRLVLRFLSILPLAIATLLFLIIAVFFSPDRIGVLVRNHNYQVSFVQSYRYDPYSETNLDLIITRWDGRRLSQQLDVKIDWRDTDLTICREIFTEIQGSRVYFRCNSQPITKDTTFVDLEKETIFVGWTQCWGELHISDLFLKHSYGICRD